MPALLLAILGFFVFPGVGFWLGLIFLSVVYTIATEADTHGFAVFSTILCVGLFWLTLKTIVFSVAWPFLLIGVGAYALLGGGWSVWRWFKYCREYIAFHPFKGVSDTDKYDYEDGKKVMVTAADYYRNKLRPSEHKSRLIGWIAYWPWSLIWNVVGDTLTAIYDALVNVYQRTAEAVIKKALGNFGTYGNKDS